MKIKDMIVERKAKKLGLSAEEYLERVKAELVAEEKQEELDEQIWVQLYMKKKIINPSAHLHYDNKLLLLNCLILVPLIYLWIGGISNIFEMKLLVKSNIYYLYFGILICVLCGFIYFIGRILIYMHDKKQFKKYKEERVKMGD